ncbi:MAG: sulfotransferase [Pseudomonadota bacterium]
MSAAELEPSTKHPLMGARLSVLLKAISENGLPAGKHLPLFALMMLSAAGRSPIHLLERSKHARVAENAPPMEDPVFVIGHWRSGTTHLHNLLGKSPAFGHISPLASGLPDEILTLGTWLAPTLEKALPEDRHVDRVAVTPDSPQEDEIPLANLQNLSVFQAVYFPKNFRKTFDRGVFFDGCSNAEIARWTRMVQHFAEKIALHQGKPLLLIKNPVYTARIQRLKAIWPKARFIHIRRNPYEVFVSTRNYYRKLLPELALQRFDHVDIDQFVLETFTRLMDLYEEEKVGLGADQLMEVSYEHLIREPIPVLKSVHDQLSLPEWDSAEKAISDYLATIADYQTNATTKVDADIKEAVDHAWGPHVAKWRALEGLSADQA